MTAEQKPRYQFREIGFPGEDTVILERIEKVGEFANRDAARQHMFDTEDERKARDAGESEASGLRKLLADAEAEVAVLAEERRVANRRWSVLHRAIEEARETLGPGDDEDEDSPGNMAFAILSAALDGGER